MSLCFGRDFVGAHFVFPGDATALSETNEGVPSMQGPVTDLAFALSKSDHDALVSLLNDFELETHHQIAVLIVPTLNGGRLESFSLEVANAWGVGLKGWNDGILITIAMRERGIRIEVGEGMERYVSNSMARAIIDKDMIPAFRRGDIAGALHTGLLRLMPEARAYKIADPNRAPTTYAPRFTETSDLVAGGGRLDGACRDWHCNASREVWFACAR